MLFQTSLGIDIQANAVSVAYLKGSFRGVRLAAYAVYPLEDGIPTKEKTDLIGGLIRDFMGKNSISPATVFLGIPRDIAIVRYVELPLAVKENLRDSLGYEMEKYVPFAADKIHFDYQVISEDKGTGKLKLLLTVAKKESIDQYLALAGQMGVGISGIEISSTALANYFSNQPDSQKGDTRAIIYLRDGYLEMDLLKGGFLSYSRSVGRTEWGTNLPGLISNELHKLKESLGEPDVRLNTVFCGFDAEAEVVNHFRTDEDIEIGLIDFSRAGIPSPAMIPAYGLALKGIQKLPTDINLVPEAFRKRPNRAGYYTMVVLAGLFILSALAWGGGSIVSQQLHLGRLNKEIDRLGVEVVNIKKAKAKCNEVEDRVKYLNGLYTSGASALDVLRELSVRIPKTAWVRKFAFSDNEVKIDGRAESSSELIPSLEGSSLFKDVVFLSTITRDKKGKETFRIGLKLD